MNPRIPDTQPSITELEARYATDAAATGRGERCYDYVHRIEDAFKAHLGVEYASATSSCTGALHRGMAALGIGPGDEVILADTNRIATAAPIVHLGAKPFFVDILEDSWCLDPANVSGFRWSPSSSFPSHSPALRVASGLGQRSVRLKPQPARRGLGRSRL